MSLLKARIAGFLHPRHFARHFRRHALLDSLVQSGVDREVPAGMTQTLVAASGMAPAQLLQGLGSHAEGLTEPQAEVLRKRWGLNEVERDKPLAWWTHLWHCYRNPFNLLLTLLAAVSWATNDHQATTVIGLMVVLSTLLRFWQEGKSNKAADALKAMVSNTATVLRRAGPVQPLSDLQPLPEACGHPASTLRVELPIKLLVPGDVIALSAGDMIPADCRVIAAKDLFVAQAALTGESMPVEKMATLRDAPSSNALELGTLLFMGTNVVSGAAEAVVLGTGQQTYFGALAHRVAAGGPVESSFHAGINKVSGLLIRFIAVMAPLVFLINGITKGQWTEALLFALSVAVGITPEMLPMIVTATLAKGAVFMSRKKVIVKRLDAIQTFGAMDVLCADKTGTLTQDKIFLARHVDVFGLPSAEVLAMAYLNSHYQTGLKNLLDVAILEHVEVHRTLEPAKNFRLVDEIPFDFVRRRMSVVVSVQNQQHLLITKGAVEEVLAACTQVRQGQQEVPMSTALGSRVRAVTDELSEQGLRVIAVAIKPGPPTQVSYSLADEQGLTLIGYIAFLDPPKESTAPALRALAAQGVAVKVLTGDNERVTAKICREVGLASGHVLLGGEVEGMTEAMLAQAVEEHSVFAKLAPAHKERIVRQLRANGHVVGFLGDGINDAAALRCADIGISVNTAVDIAKEAADIILLEKSLMVLVEGVQEGRRTFANMLKYIKATASSNFGNVFSVLVASAFIPFLPMLPLHLLVQNLLYDISQIAIPFDQVDEDLLRQPQRWQPGEIGRFMLFFGPISSVFDLTTFALMWFVFGAKTPAQQTLFQSGWFIVGLLTQTLIVHMIRTVRLPFIQSRAATPILVMTGLIMALGIYLPMGPLAHFMKLQALPALYFVWLPLILLAYMGLTQAMKGVYRRRYGWQ